MRSPEIKFGTPPRWNAAAGIWGVIAVGLVHDVDGLFICGSGRLLCSQLIGLLTIVALTAPTTAALCLGLRRIGWLRVAALQEEHGGHHAHAIHAPIR